MTNKEKFDYRKWRIRQDGEPYRRLFIYITIVDGKVHDIETTEPNEKPSDAAGHSDLCAFLDTFRDGTSIVTIIRENRADALFDFLKDTKHLVPISPASMTYAFNNRAAMGSFQIACCG